MRIVRLCLLIDHFMEIEIIELLWMLMKEVAADHRFRTIGIGLLTVDTAL